MTKSLGAGLILLCLFKIIGGMALPVTTDEGYYFLWARHPDLGYFDHPPLVAWLAAPVNWLAGSWLAGRSGSLLLAVLLIPLSLSLTRRAGLRGVANITAAMLLFHFNLAGLVFGFLATPDIPLIFFWTLALHEALVALQGRPRRWLSAGLATGLGIWGKYTMLLMGPVFLLALLSRSGRAQLRTPWPWAGGLVCLLVISPHLFWNQQNHWPSFSFQLRHGFQDSHETSVPMASTLPPPLKYQPDSAASRLGDYFKGLKKREKKKKKPKKDPLTKAVQGFSDFAGGQLAVFGFMIFPLGYTLYRRRQRRDEAPEALPAAPRALLMASAGVPLVVFGLISLGQKVEANWASAWIPGGAVLLAAALPWRRRGLTITAAANLLILTLVIVHAGTPLRKKRPHKDRVLRETAGYAGLADHLRPLPRPVFADTYQLVSMLHFYEPDRPWQQWPGLTRFSEITRRPALNPLTVDQLNAAGGFYLVSANLPPPDFPGFTAVDLEGFRACLQGQPELLRAWDGRRPQKDCRPVHEWYIAAYEPQSGIKGEKN